MPPMSGLNIRKLIATRRLSDGSINGADLKSEDSLPPVPFGVPEKDRDGSGNSHVANRHLYYKRRAPSPVIVMGSLTHSDILRPLPPLPRETPRSSVSSSSTCELHDGCDCPIVNRKRNSIPLKELTEGSTLLSCIDTFSPDDTLTQRVPKSRFNLSTGPKNKEEAIPALSSEKDHKGISEALSEELQQFILEAEDAFKAIGEALPEAYVEQRTSFDSITKPRSFETPREVPTPPLRRISPAPHSQSPSKISPIPSNTPHDTPKTITPAPKPRRRKSKTSRKPRPMRSQRRPAAPKQAVKSGARWALTENVSELLTGKLFQKIEADEMLTPDQIEYYKQRRIRRYAEEKAEAEASARSSLDTSTEPSHIDDLTSQTLLSDMKSETDVSPTRPPSAVSFSGDALRRNSLKGSQKQTQEPRPGIQKSNTFSTLSTRPLKLPARRRMSELPVIAEASPILQPNNGLLSHNNSEESLVNTFNNEYVYLQSSPRSAMTPKFRHGPIRLSKADLVPDVRLGGDDVLDWTAFQMAILGGAGEWVPEDEPQSRKDGEEIDDIVEWWDSWHFESTGELVTHEYAVPSPTSTLSGDEVPDYSYWGEFENEYITPQYEYSPPQYEYTPPQYPWPERSESRTPNLRLDLEFVRGALRTSSQYGHAHATPTYPWREDSLPKHVPSHRESVNSLPPSPMLDLRVRRTETGDELDVVPMGYNLGHDLGDFLRWEAEHAYGGFTSPGGMLN